MRRILLSLLLAAALGALRAPVARSAAAHPVATPASVDLWGSSVRFVLAPGDVVSARSAAGAVCGLCRVTVPGYYGLLHVYGDDPSTPQVEGARRGERLELEVNGRQVRPAGREPVWTRDGDRQRVNIAR